MIQSENQKIKRKSFQVPVVCIPNQDGVPSPRKGSTSVVLSPLSIVHQILFVDQLPKHPLGYFMAKMVSVPGKSECVLHSNHIYLHVIDDHSMFDDDKDYPDSTHSVDSFESHKDIGQIEVSSCNDQVSIDIAGVDNLYRNCRSRLSKCSRASISDFSTDDQDSQLVQYCQRQSSKQYEQQQNIKNEDKLIKKPSQLKESQVIYESPLRNSYVPQKSDSESSQQPSQSQSISDQQNSMIKSCPNLYNKIEEQAQSSGKDSYSNSTMPGRVIPCGVYQLTKLPGQKQQLKKEVQENQPDFVIVFYDPDDQYYSQTDHATNTQTTSDLKKKSLIQDILHEQHLNSHLQRLSEMSIAGQQ